MEIIEELLETAKKQHKANLFETCIKTLDIVRKLIRIGIEAKKQVSPPGPERP
ncbi:hypothetical protein ES703_57478 [subsurface metagenome]